jgi:hypothetical protein
MANSADSCSATVTIEAMEKRPESAVAGGIAADSQKNQVPPETLAQISKGREELKDLMDKQK